MEVKLIPNTPEALQELYALRQLILREPLGLNLFEEDLAAEENEIKIGAFITDKLVGCLMLKIVNNKTLKLRQMAVNTTFQGKQIGKQLVLFAEHWGQEQGYNCIELHARESAIKFYEKLNYQTSSEVFTEVGINHVCMYKLMKNE
jgi:predicted GNAT family N-acyltransferase